MHEARPKVIIIAGPNGAGKSTLAPSLLRDTFHVTDYVNADTLASGLSAFQPDKVAIEAGRLMLKRLRVLAEQQESFAFESTLASRSHARWLNDLREEGYTFHLLFLWLRNPETAVARVKERVRLGGHDVPEPVVRRRYRRGIINFLELYRPLAESWVVYDNSGPGSPLALAAAKEDRVLSIYQPSLWSRFSEK